MLKFSRRAGQAIVSIPLMLMSLITIALFTIVILSSLKTHDQILENILGLPTTPSIDNFITLFSKYHFGQYLSNSLIVTFCTVALVLYIASLVSYGLTRFQFKGRSILQFYFLIGLMLPAQLGIVPLYVLIRELRLTNTLMSVILIGAAGVSMPIFVLSAFMRTIPQAVVESARIDGASEFRIFHRIALPLMRPPLGALIPLLAIGSWNDFFMPLIFLVRDNVKTVPLGVMHFYTGQYLDLTKLHLVFTAATVSILPILIVYLIASKHIVAGITDGAVKQ